MNNLNKEIRAYFKANLPRPTYDTRQGTEKDNVCFLLLDMNNDRSDETKCNIALTHTLTIEAIERVPRFGNQGNRGLLDDMTNEVYNAFDFIELTGHRISNKSISDNSVVTYDRNEIINRNILTINFKIN